MTLSKNFKTIASVVVLVATIWYFLPLNCSGKHNSDDIKKVTIDTTIVDKTIKIPEKREIFENIDPTPEKNSKQYDNNLINKYKKLLKENDRLKAYEEAVSTQVYYTNYSSKDSTVTVSVRDSIRGELLRQKVDIKIKERDIVYKDTVITKTIIKKEEPKFSISTGVSAQIGTNLIYTKPNVGFTVGFKNKSNYTLDLNYNTQGSVMVTLKKDLISF